MTNIKQIAAEILNRELSSPIGMSMNEYVNNLAAKATWINDEAEFFDAIMTAFSLPDWFIEGAKRNRLYFCYPGLRVLFEQIYTEVDPSFYKEVMQEIIQLLKLESYPNIHCHIFYSLAIGTPADRIDQRATEIINKYIKENFPEDYKPLAVLNVNLPTGEVSKWPIYDQAGKECLNEIGRRFLDHIQALINENKKEFKKQKREIRRLLNEAYKVDPDFSRFIEWYQLKKPFMKATIEAGNGYQRLEIEELDRLDKIPIPEVETLIQEYCLFAKNKFEANYKKVNRKGNTSLPKKQTTVDRYCEIVEQYHTEFETIRDHGRAMRIVARKFGVDRKTVQRALKATGQNETKTDKNR